MYCKCSKKIYTWPIRFTRWLKKTYYCFKWWFRLFLVVFFYYYPVACLWNPTQSRSGPAVMRPGLVRWRSPPQPGLRPAPRVWASSWGPWPPAPLQSELSPPCSCWMPRSGTSKRATWQYLRNIRKEMFYLTTHSTHFIYGYMASDIRLRTTQIVRGNLLPPHRLLFPINSKGSFICTIPQTG